MTVVADAPILVKRYAHARLYDTFHRRYITVALLRDWQRCGISFVVLDTETGDDVTRVLLA
jgi:polyhydroxyalkanoate synthesis regulator protein